LKEGWGVGELERGEVEKEGDRYQVSGKQEETGKQ